MLGHRDAKLDLKKVSTPVTGLRPVDDDATTGNSRTEFFQTLHLRSDLGSDLFRWLAIPKRDFDWGLHIEPSHAAAPQEIKCYTSDCAAPFATCRLRDPVLVSLNSEASSRAAMPVSAPLSDLGVEADERRILSAHVPETHVLSADNADMLAERKAGFVFKPRHGYASRGLLDSASVGHGRLRRLLRRGEGYVAQRRIAKAAVQVEGRRCGPTCASGPTGAKSSSSPGARRGGAS